MRRLTVLLLGMMLLAWPAAKSSAFLVRVVSGNTATQSLTGVGLSASTYPTGASAGTVIGAVSVTISPSAPSFSGTLTLTGAAAADFSLSNTTLPANLITNSSTPTCASSNTNFNINIVAMQNGVRGTPFVQPETITCTTSGGDPTVGLLPADRSAYASWKIAGLQTVGGIAAIDATRPVCATVTPNAVGTDSAAKINAQIATCASAHPAGSIVVLSTGEFDVCNASSCGGGVVLGGKISNVTLRGSPNATTGKYCALASSPYCDTVIKIPQSMGGSFPGNQGNCCNQVVALGGLNIGAPVGPNTVALTANGTFGNATIGVASIPGSWTAGTWVAIDEYANFSMQPDYGFIAAGYPGAEVWASPNYSLTMPTHYIPGYTPGSGTGAAAGCAINDEYCGSTTITNSATTGQPALLSFPPSGPGTNQVNNNQPVALFTQGTLPAPLVQNTIYYTTNSNQGAHTTNISLTPGGAAINTTTAGSGVINWVGDAEDFGLERFSQSATNLGERYTEEIKQIKSVVSSPCCTITFDSPLTTTYRAAAPYSAHVFDFESTLTSYSGLEDVSLAGSSGNGDLSFTGCAYCWAETVEATGYDGGSFQMSACLRCEVVNFLGWKSNYPYIGGAGYNAVVNHGTTESLIHNSIFTYGEKVMVGRATGGGNVAAYDYFDIAFDANADQGGLGFVEVEDGCNASHWLSSHHFLFEGDYCFSLDSDTTWGESPFITYFRSYASGFRAPYFDYINNWSVNDILNQATGTTESGRPRRSSEISAHTYWASMIGNVLGTNGYNYSNSPSNPDNQAYVNQISNTYTTTGCLQGTIWSLGTDCGNPEIDAEVYYTGAGGPSDPASGNCVSPSGDYCPIVRLGNYSYLTGAIDTAAAVPNSFYLASQPSYFGASGAACSYPWPWVTPSLSPQIQPAIGCSVSTTATGSSGANTFTVASATGIYVGGILSGGTIPAGTPVNSVSGTTIGIGIPLTGNMSSAAITFSPVGLPAKARWDAGTPFLQP